MKKKQGILSVIVLITIGITALLLTGCKEPVNVPENGEKTITNVDVTVTAPIVDEEPNVTASANGSFTVGNITWNPNDNPFKPLTRYTATVRLTVNSGYTFSGLTSATINGVNAEISRNTGTAVTLSYRFPATAAAADYSVSLDVPNIFNDTYTFGNALVGYAPQDLTVKIKNTGIYPTGDLTVTLSGSNVYTLSTNSINSIAVGGEQTFTIQLDAGLGIKSYIASVTVSGNDVRSRSLKIYFTVTPPPDTAWLRVSQAGYTTDYNKTAVVLSDANIEGTVWKIKNANSIVLDGILPAALPKDDYYVSQDYSYIIDFSGLETNGIYTLEIPNIESQQIRVTEDPYSLFVTQAIRHLRVVRSGTEDTLLRPGSHFGDERAIVYEPNSLTNGSWRERSPRRLLDMMGGHYDAGDYIKFTLTQAYLCWHLLFAYEVNPKLFVTVLSNSGLPDILDEAKHSLDNLAKTFPDNDTFVVQVGDTRDHNQGRRLPHLDRLDGNRPALTALSRVHMGLTAASLALGARIFSDFDTEAATLYGDKAIAIYARARQSDAIQTVFERGGVNDYYRSTNDVGSMALAAMELYALTNEQSYLDNAIAYDVPSNTTTQWNNMNAWVNYRLATTGKNETAKDRFLQGVSRYERTDNNRTNIWGFTTFDYGWGPLIYWTDNASAHYLASKLEGNTTPTAPFLGVVNYIFGQNNWGISMFASLDLPFTFKNAYNDIYRITGAYPIGLLSEGPARTDWHRTYRVWWNFIPDPRFDRFSTPAGVFYDDANDFVIAEGTISGQAGIILLLSLASKQNLFPEATMGTEPDL